MEIQITMPQNEPITADVVMGESSTIRANVETEIGSTNNHPDLLGRNLPEQHPISAITNLTESLSGLQNDIDNEVTARENGDSYVEGLVQAEEGRAVGSEEAIERKIDNHIADVNNPHQVTKAQIGLGNADNTSDMDKPISSAVQSALAGKVSDVKVNNVSVVTSNVANVDLSGYVTTNTGQTISGAKTFSNIVTMAGQTPIAASHNYNSYAVFQRLPNTREQIFSNGGDKLRLRGSETRPKYNGNDLALYSDVTAEGADLTAHINNRNNPHQVTKAQVGLSNVSNLAPADLPISTATQNALDVVNGDIDDIEELIPNQATASNQLADKSFVNSSISTNTANFIGTFNSVAELEAYSGTVTNNDYAFVETTDTAGNTLYDRYKYTDSTNSWQFEYELNNSSFTANQWAAINSGATATNIGQIATNTNAITSINTTIGGYGNIVTYDADDFATAAQGDKADTAVQPADLSTVATTGDYDDLIDKPTIPTDTSDLTNNAGFITSSALSGYATQTWVGNQGYITGITSGDVTTALGYTPYNSTNPDGYITGITSGDVTSALGYTPYNSSNPNGYTSNVGTVTSVNNTSPDGSGNVTLTLPDPLPSQTGHSGEYLTTDGTDASWGSVAVLPSQTGHSGEFLTTDGTDPSWADVDALPSQTGHSGDLLTTDGTDASWVDTDTIYPVVETYSNGTSWYRVYSDGWVEQGGQLSSLGTGTATVTLLKPFADTNYTVSSCGYVDNSTGQYGYIRNAPTTTTIKFKGTGTITNFYWMACGYGA